VSFEALLRTLLSIIKESNDTLKTVYQSKHKM